LHTCRWDRSMCCSDLRKGNREVRESDLTSRSWTLHVSTTFGGCAYMRNVCEHARSSQICTLVRGMQVAQKVLRIHVRTCGSCFHFRWPDFRRQCVAIEGDVACANLGMCAEDLAIIKASCSIIFHCLGPSTPACVPARRLCCSSHAACRHRLLRILTAGCAQVLQR
jgi:hypothetical protein